MRKLSLVVTLSVVIAVFVFVPATGAGAKTPVKLDGRVNAHGKTDVSKESKAALEVALDNYFFSPTFTKVQAGQKITIELKNEGGTAHTFTSDELSVDKEVQPGKSAKIKVTIPSDVKAVQYYCQFHDSDGMQGAFYTASGASASPGANSDSGSSSGSGSGSGY